MLEAAKPHLLRILGPNCVGLLVPGIGLNASFAAVAALPGRITFVAQSGALVTAVLDWARARRIGHTGALAGADLVYDAALRRAGMLRVHTTSVLFDAVSILAQSRRPGGKRLAILTNGGGPGAMATDALIGGGGALAQLEPATMARLSQGLPPTWSGGNPVDIIGDAPVERYGLALQALLDESGADAVLLIHAPTAIVPSADIARALLPLLRPARRAVRCCWLGGD